MSFRVPEKWLIYAGFLLAAMLFLPYFGFLVRDVGSSPAGLESGSQNTATPSKSPLDELLQQHGK